MTVSSTVNREQYATDGVSTAFTIHFPFFVDTDINAIFVTSGGVSTTLARNVDFTVTGGVGAGGTLTTTGSMSPLATGGTLTVYRGIPFTQETDYVEDDPLPADTLEGDIDRAVMRDQELQDALDRALTFPVTIDPTVSAELPTPEADTYLGWNSAADELENKTLPAGSTVYASISNTRAGSSAVEAVTPDGLASLWQEGAALVSAASIAKPADASLGGIYTQSGNTGTNTYWAGTVGGERMWVRYTGTPLLGTSGNLVPPNNASYQIIAGDMILWIWDAAATKWRAYSGMRADGTPLIVASAGGYVTTAITRAVTSADNNKTIDFSASSTSATLPAAASNTGLKVTLKNSAASGDVTIDPNASETLDGLTTRLLRPGDRVTIVCTGSAWITVDGEYTYESGQQTVTASAKLTLAHGLGKKPERIRVQLECTSADLNYSVGNFVDVNMASTNGSFQFTPRDDATNIDLIVSGVIYIIDATGFTFGSITTTKWKWRVRAWTR